MRTSCYVIGAAYSGSTLLSALMDTQESARGIGEAVRQIYHPNFEPWCGSCNQEAKDCDRRPKFDGPEIHKAYFDAYPDARVLFDISKSWENCFDRQHTPYPIKIVTLAKWPHAFAWSQLNHFRRKGETNRTVRECFDAWVLAYESAQKLFDMHSGFTFRRRVAVGGAGPHYPMINADDIYVVSYHDLTLHTAETIAGICNFVGIGFNETLLANWWRPTDTCTVGGNRAIYAQRNNPTFFTDAEDNPDQKYLGGKYIGKQGEIFHDTSWLDDPQFIKEAAQCYKDLERRLRPLCWMFGLERLTTCVAALRNP